MKRAWTTQSSLEKHKARRSSRVVWLVIALAGLGLGALLIWITPRDKPVVTVYMHQDCDSCRRWMEHLAARGFRTQLGREADWASLRSRFAIPARLQSSHSAMVDGLFIEGPVPSSDIHQALKLRSSYRITALVVPGVPRGSPGAESPLPQPYTVFAVRDGGRIQEFAEHGH